MRIEPKRDPAATPLLCHLPRVQTVSTVGNRKGRKANEKMKSESQGAEWERDRYYLRYKKVRPQVQCDLRYSKLRLLRQYIYIPRTVLITLLLLSKVLLPRGALISRLTSTAGDAYNSKSSSN